jgi:hypothetical protein
MISKAAVVESRPAAAGRKAAASLAEVRRVDKETKEKK